MNLTDRQRAAVEAPAGALFISAAAGSGKTRVLTERFARLVRGAEDGSCERAELSCVAAVTFTDKAAGELSERIRGALAREGDVRLARNVQAAWIGTIHGLCSRILRRHAFEAGLDPAFKTADDVLSGMLREQAFSEVVRELVPRSDALSRLVTDYDVSRLAEDIRNADEYLRSLGAPVDALVSGEGAQSFGPAFLELLHGYAERYEVLKDQAGVLDFEDLQLLTLRLLRAHPAIADSYSSQFREVMVDEFQDTNQLQVSVVEALSGSRISTVGDDKQSIYGWRNADVEVFRRRADEVPEERRFTLPENFRSHRDLVGFFNAVFEREPFWLGDFLTLESGAGEASDAGGPWPEGAPRIRLTLLDDTACRDADSADAEALAVASQLAELRDAGVPQGDMVVLLRAMTRAEHFAEALRDAGMNVFVASGGTYFETHEAEELGALLQAVANSRNDEAFARLLAGSCANVSDDALLLLRLAAEDRSLFEAASDETRAMLAEPDESAVRRLVAALERARSNQGRVSLYELVHDLAEDLDLDLVLLAGGNSRGWANLQKYARIAAEFESTAPGDLAALLEYVDTRMRHARYEQQATTAAENVDAVRIMSVHSAKGLEFPVVAMPELGKPPRKDTRDFKVGLIDGVPTLGVRLPCIDGADDKDRVTPGLEAVSAWQDERNTAEAKRLFYVASTRASRGLLLFGRTKVGGRPQERPADWLTSALELDLARLAEQGGRSDLDLDGVPVRVDLTGAPTACLARTSPPPEPIPLAEYEPSGGPQAGAGLSRAPERVSFTALERHRTCGYLYYVRDVLRLVSSEGVASPSDARSVGIVVHEALRYVDSHRAPDSARIAETARLAGLSPEESQRVETVVRSFAAMPVAAEAYEGDRIGHEVPFATAVGDSILEGTIDLISWKGPRALIVDYKTGTHESTEESLERWRRQAQCYALAVLRAGADEVRVVFAQPERGTDERFRFSRADLAAIESEIGAEIDRIAAAEFKPLDSFSSLACTGCPALGGLCPVTPPRRRGGAA